MAGALSALVVLTITAAVVYRARCTGPAAATEAGAAYWGPKVIALEDAPARAEFRPLVPGSPPTGLRLAEAQLVWVQQDEFDPRLHPRQALRLTYRGQTPGRGFSITQVARISYVEAKDNVWQILSGAYFEADQGMNSLLSVGTESGVDFVIISNGLSPQEAEAVKRSLGPMEVPGG